MHTRVFLVLPWLTAAALILMVTGFSPASAQIPDIPSTVFGSVTDSAGPVPPGLVVEAYVGDKLCGKGDTELTGDGDARVTVYFADVVSSSQTAGCGSDGAEVRLKIGDRFAPQTARWQKGPVQLDVTFGTATPAPIPTFTPTPPRTNTPRPQQTAGVTSTPPAASPTQPGTIPAGSPGAGSPYPTLPGGLTSSTPAPGQGPGDDGGDGFPVWAIVLLVLGGIAAVGGGVGYAMSRGNGIDDPDDDLFAPPGASV
jgi:hypothetical protein